jgi:hypothetical protein
MGRKSDKWATPSSPVLYAGGHPWPGRPAGPGLAARRIALATWTYGKGWSGPPCPTPLRPAGGPPLKRPHGCFRGGLRPSSTPLDTPRGKPMLCEVLKHPPRNSPFLTESDTFRSTAVARGVFQGMTKNKVSENLGRKAGVFGSLQKTRPLPKIGVEPASVPGHSPTISVCDTSGSKVTPSQVNE